MVQHVKRCADSFRLFRCIFTAFIVIVGGYGEPWMRLWLVVRRRHWSSLLVRCVVWTRRRRRRRRRSYITRWWSRVASPRLACLLPTAYCLPLSTAAQCHRRLVADREMFRIHLLWCLKDDSYILDEVGWRRRWDLQTRRCNCVRNTDWSSENAEFVS